MAGIKKGSEIEKTLCLVCNSSRPLQGSTVTVLQGGSRCQAAVRASCLGFRTEQVGGRELLSTIFVLLAEASSMVHRRRAPTQPLLWCAGKSRRKQRKAVPIRQANRRFRSAFEFRERPAIFLEGRGSTLSLFHHLHHPPPPTRHRNSTSTPWKSNSRQTHNQCTCSSCRIRLR